MVFGIATVSAFIIFPTLFQETAAIGSVFFLVNSRSHGSAFFRWVNLPYFMGPSDI